VCLYSYSKAVDFGEYNAETGTLVRKADFPERWWIPFAGIDDYTKQSGEKIIVLGGCPEAGSKSRIQIVDYETLEFRTIVGRTQHTLPFGDVRQARHRYHEAEGTHHDLDTGR
jgi:hypothetical protein